MITTKTLSDGRTYTLRSNRDRFFYPKEWLQFKEAVNPRFFFPFEFLINTGARINEARNVKVSDFDFENKRLVLRVTKIKAKLGQKNPRPRIIPISTQFIKKVKKHIRENKLKSDSFIGIPSTPAANQLLKRGVKRSGIEDWQMFSIHNIRKTLENWLLALGIDSLKVVSHVGHSMGTAASSYISADVFSHNEKVQIREILGDLYLDSLRRY